VKISRLPWFDQVSSMKISKKPLSAVVGKISFGRAKYESRMREAARDVSDAISLFHRIKVLAIECTGRYW
jgi:hypothetical protein